MRAPSSPKPNRPYAYVAVGAAVGLVYALLNAQADHWARAETIGRLGVAFHALVDDVIPVVAGALVGLAFHWVHLRARFARAEARRVDELKARLGHVERDQAVWVVAASALHELKNPLHALGLLVDELEDVARTGNAEEVRAHVARVRTLMDRTLEPLEALRALTRQGHRDACLKPIGETIADVVLSLEPLAARRGAVLRVEGEVPPLTVDGEYVRVILDNLVANALEGRGERGSATRVVVRARRGEDGRVVVRVCDDGPGLAEEDEEDVFATLRSRPRTGAKAGGLGLGLPIARALARTLGGELALVRHPDPDLHTAFELTVPADRCGDPHASALAPMAAE